MSNLKQLKRKVHTVPELITTIHQWKAEHQSIVFTNGCFDLLHLGHIDYLTSAADLGHKFVIGLNSDDSVKRLKGHNRPIKDQYTRLMILAAFNFTDAIVLFEEDTPENLIKQIIPDVLVKGGDYSVSEIVGAQHVMQNGGHVAILPFLNGHSSTLLEASIKENG